MAEHPIEPASNGTDTHDVDCAFVCALLNQYPSAAYEAYKNAPASIQADIDVAQAYLESRQAHCPNVYLPDHEKARIASGNGFSPEGEACLVNLLDRFAYYTDLSSTPEAAFAMMKMERSDMFKKEMPGSELPIFD